MSTLSVPLTPELEKTVNNLVNSGYGSNKADVVRRALKQLSEEQAIADVLQAERELTQGKVFRGDLRKLIKQLK